ncbi:Hint domain-containing protein [Planktotalea sp.]|uniref:Hint domain-containing protein n=1 Tax=Planktotalea sp. TaxID=2029877 RepID=UPI003D6A002F
MPTTTIVNMFYLGNFADIDTDERDSDVENGASLFGDYGKPQIISVTENDQNDDRAISDDEYNSGGDTISYNAGSGTHTGELDSTSWYIADVTLGDGSVQQVNVAVLQMANGDVLIRDVGNSLDNLNIQNFSLTSLRNSNYSGERTGNSIENTQMVCFLRGTLIETDNGAVAIETLKIGSRVLTADKGFQPLLWIGCGRLEEAGKHAPIIIRPGALGDGAPSTTLKVSPQHRILLASKIAERMFGTREVLVPAIRLLPLEGVEQSEPHASVQYWHVLTKSHQLVCANGAWAETFYPGPHGITALSHAAQREICAIMPLAFGAETKPKVRFEPSRLKQKKLVSRHLANAKPVLDQSHRQRAMPAQ